MSLLTSLGMASMAFVAWFTWRAYRSADSGAGQSKRASIIEAWVNILIGFSINYAANVVLIPLMADGAHVTATSNFWGGWVYTAISIVRQYTVRRWFNTHSFALFLARRFG
jgi:hypothetical protein